MVNLSNSEEIYKVVLSYLPKSIRVAKSGYGSFLTFDLGKRIGVSENNHSKYEIHLWVYLCDWALYQGEKVISTSDDSSETIQNILDQLKNEKMIAIKEVSVGKRIDVKFSGDFRLVLASNLDIYEESDDLFHMFIEGKDAISYSPQNGFYSGET